MRLIIIIFLMFSFHGMFCHASVGDNTPFFRKCLEDCKKINCSKDGSKYKADVKSTQPLINRLFLWQCKDECQYDCMWRTVNLMTERKWKFPQFYGKWPFKRVFGMQEFGSVLGSLLNLFAHIVNFKHLKKFITNRHRFYWLWKSFYLVCLNAWTWSTIFHMRDTPFTEFMDYMCAFSMVLMVFYCFGVRALYPNYTVIGFIFSPLCILFFINHAFYLYYSNIDYEYNMMANVAVGTFGGVSWVLWCCYHLCRGRFYVWRCLLFVVLTAASMLLELNDFPPVLSMWDAHALWHLSTAPLPFLFYRFMIDDSKEISTSMYKPSALISYVTKLQNKVSSQIKSLFTRWKTPQMDRQKIV